MPLSTKASGRVQTLALRRYELGEGGTAWPTVALLCGALLCQAAAAYAGDSGLLPVWAAVALAGACAYAQFTVSHDAAHRSVSRWAWLNDACGLVATAVLCGPFDAFRVNHLHHHGHTNDPSEDPDFWVAGTSVVSTVARCATLFWVHYWVYFTRLRRPDRAFTRTLTTLAVLAAVAAGGVGAGLGRGMLLYWLLPAQLAGTALAVLFDYWPHRPHAFRGRLRDTAVVAPRWLDAPMLGQNVHLLHHLHPTVPWYRYRAAFERLRPAVAAEGALIWDLPTALKMLRPGAVLPTRMP